MTLDCAMTVLLAQKADIEWLTGIKR
jgi:hypothetical protein